MPFTEHDSEKLQLSIIDMVEDIRLRVLKYGYKSRHIKIIIPEKLRPALADFSLAPYAGFTYAIEYRDDLEDDIFVYPVLESVDSEGWLPRILRVFRKWLDF